MSNQPIPGWVAPALAHLMMGSLTLIATPLDPSFGSGGTASMLVGTHDNTPRRIALQDDGKIVMCGWALNNSSRNSYGYDVGLVRFNADGTPDTAFGVDGTLSTDVGSSYPVYTDDRGDAVVIQPDNKIIVAGTTRQYTKSGSVSSFDWNQWDVLLLRYLADGSLDTNFGTNGMVVIDIKGSGTSPEKFNEVALQSDNKIIAVGSTYPNRFLIMRFNPDGAVDTSFGTSGTGIIEEHFAPNTYEDAYSVLILPDDSIVVVGRGVKSDGYDTFCMLKLTSGGLLDTNFNSTGKVTMNIGRSSQGWNSATDSTGRILVLGSDQATSSSPYQARMMRFNSNGSLDSSFNGTGVFTASFPGYSGLIAGGLDVENDGAIVAVGSAGFSPTEAFVRIRLNEDGTADETFGPDGMVATSLSGASYYAVGNCALQKDGKLLIGTSFQLATAEQPFSVLRYTATDSGVRPDGIPMDWITDHFGSNEDAPQEVIKGGRIVSLLDAYLLGEDPLNPNDLIRIQGLAPHEDGMSVIFPTLVGRAYQIESSPDMTPESWEPVGDRLLGDANSVDVILPKDITRKFFRITISLP